MLNYIKGLLSDENLNRRATFKDHAVLVSAGFSILLLVMLLIRFIGGL